MINTDYLEQLSAIADMLDMIGAKKEASVIDKFIKKIAEGEISVDTEAGADLSAGQAEGDPVNPVGEIDVKKSLEESDRGYFDKTLKQRNPGPNSAGSTFATAMTRDDIINADWQPANDPSITPPAKGFTANIPGLLGVVATEDLDDSTPVVFQVGHGGALAGMAEAVAVLEDSDRHVDTTTLILGPKDSGDGFELWTFFPGSALPQGEPISMDKVRQVTGSDSDDKIPGTVADAKKLGFKIIKHVPQLPQG